MRLAFQLTAVFLLLFFSAQQIFAQLDYTKLYEHYKKFEQNKHVLIYAGAAEIYGRYDNVNKVLTLNNKPTVSAFAESVSCGVIISQDRLLVGFELVEFHNLLVPGSYSQNGGFEYVYAGYKLYMSRKNELAVTGGLGVGVLNIYTYPPAGVSVWGPKFKPDNYGLYNIHPLGAGFGMLNFTATWTHYFNSFLFAGAVLGLDAIPSSNWNLKNTSHLQSIITHEQGTGKGYLGYTFGSRFNH
jgi:hypothetical protein